MYRGYHLHIRRDHSHTSHSHSRRWGSHTICHHLPHPPDSLYKKISVTFLGTLPLSSFVLAMAGCAAVAAVVSLAVIDLPASSFLSGVLQADSTVPAIRTIAEKPQSDLFHYVGFCVENDAISLCKGNSFSLDNCYMILDITYIIHRLY